MLSQIIFPLVSDTLAFLPSAVLLISTERWANWQLIILVRSHRHQRVQPKFVVYRSRGFLLRCAVILRRWSKSISLRAIEATKPPIFFISPCVHRTIRIDQPLTSSAFTIHPATFPAGTSLAKQGMFGITEHYWFLKSNCITSQPQTAGISYSLNEMWSRHSNIIHVFSVSHFNIVCYIV